MTIEQIFAAQPLFVIILEFIILIGAFLGTIGAGIKWLTKHYFDEIKSELKPNHGSSMKDQVTRLEREHAELKQKIDDNHNDITSRVEDIYKLIITTLSK